MKKMICILCIAVMAVLLLADCAIATVYPSLPNVQALYEAYDYILDGVQYQLPTPVKALIDNGWTLTTTLNQDADSEMLDAMTYRWDTVLKKGDASIEVQTLNATDTALTLSDCCICMIKISNNPSFPNNCAGSALFSLSNGITAGMSVAEVMQCLGVEMVYLEGDKNNNVCLTDYWTGEESWHAGNKYFLLKDGKYFNDISNRSDGSQGIIFDYKVIVAEQPNVLRDMVSLKGDNNLKIWFSGPASDPNSKVAEFVLNLMLAPNQGTQEETEAEAVTEGWICENGHAGNTGNFCTECGAPKPADKPVCGNCGYEFDGEVPKFCPNCGSAQG